jgi:hypothetical protein
MADLTGLKRRLVGYLQRTRSDVVKAAVFFLPQAAVASSVLRPTSYKYLNTTQSTL